MLRWEPEDRLLETECLRRGREIGYLDEKLWRTGITTPRLRPESGANIVNSEEVSIIRRSFGQIEQIYFG